MLLCIVYVSYIYFMYVVCMCTYVCILYFFNGVRPRELKPFLEKNKFECRPDAIDSHFKFLRLMEQFGLSRVENERSLQAQLTSMHWRVKHSGNMTVEISYFRR